MYYAYQVYECSFAFNLFVFGFFAIKTIRFFIDIFGFIASKVSSFLLKAIYDEIIVKNYCIFVCKFIVGLRGRCATVWKWSQTKNLEPFWTEARIFKQVRNFIIFIQLTFFRSIWYQGIWICMCFKHELVWDGKLDLQTLLSWFHIILWKLGSVRSHYLHLSYFIIRLLVYLDL